MSERPIRVGMHPLSMPSQPYLDGLVAGLRHEAVESAAVSAQQVWKGAYDVVHYHWPEFVLAGSHRGKALRVARRLLQVQVARHRGAAIVTTAHNAKPHDRSLSRFDRWYLRRFDAAVDHVLMLSRAGVDTVHRHRPNLATTPYTHTRHGDFRHRYVELPDQSSARRDLGLPADVPVVAFVGAVRPYKGVLELIDAAADLDARVVIAGSCRDADYAQAIHERVRGVHNVDLRLAHLSDDELIQVVRAADVVALPYRNVLNSGSALMALSMDRPVLLPDTPTFRELHDEVGEDWVVLYEDDQISRASIEAALSTERGVTPNLTNHDWKPIARATRNAYEEALAARPVRHPRRRGNMLNNLVNRHDATRVRRKLAKLEGGRIAELVRPGSQRRVENAWKHTSSPPTHWWNVPGMRQRWNAMVTGDASLGPRRWALDTFLGGRSGLVGLSIGCGTGARERDWVATEAFERLDGIDLSAPRIEHAQSAANEAGMGDVLRFAVADLMTFGDPGSYDIIIAEQALHHFAPMDVVVERLCELLHPDGVLYLDEFVGPTRFQWTDEQVIAAEELLSLLPDSRRIDFYTGASKDRVIRPSRLAMRLKDPSEAIESERILPEVERNFEIAACNGYGGTVLHLALQGIAQNFAEGGLADTELVERMFAFEDEKLAVGLPHDHVVVVAKHKDRE